MILIDKNLRNIGRQLCESYSFFFKIKKDKTSVLGVI